MGIRKEQVLLLLTLGVGALVARSLLQEGVRAQTWTPKALAREVPPVPSVTMLDAAAAPPSRKDLFLEPRETRPLPPRELDFPPRAPLSIAAVPLDPGPDYGHLWQIRTEGAPVENVVLQTAAEAAPAATPTEAEAPVAETAEQKAARYAKVYDRIYEVGKRAPFWGTIELQKDQNLYDLEAKTDFSGVEVHLRIFNMTKGTVEPTRVFGAGDSKIEKIVLAETLRNEVQRAIHKLPQTAATLGERGKLIAWLLEKAREETWVYDTALEQAKLYSNLSKGDLEGLRLQQRVLQARGDLAAEFALLEGLAGDYQDSAFRYEGLGVVKARLALWADAENDLRRAVELAPTDARPHVALAEFLRSRGRSREALVSARRIEQTFGSLLDATERVRAVRTLVGCHLANGAVDGAKAALQMLAADQAQPYLEGAVLYAAGDVATALSKFRQVGASADSGAAALAQGACLVRLGQWQEANDTLLKVYDQEPLLRHRAATALALLFVRINQLDNALVWLDRATEADPQDPYAFYLRGHVLRRQGQLAPAGEALATALRQRDDFVHAVAEMAALQARRAREGGGTEQAQATVAARRYGEHAVQLAESVGAPPVELLEASGVYSFAAADPRAAATAFAAARDTATKDDEKLWAKGALAIVDYSRNLVDDAQTSLQRIVRDLPKDAPMRTWAETTLAAIEDHAKKETLEDGFERGDLGNVWEVEVDGNLKPAIRDNRLFVQGKFTRNGDVWARRVNAVQKGKNFLAVGCTMQLAKGQARADGTAGLRLEIERSAGVHDLRVQLGVRDGKPFLQIEDGRGGANQDNVVTPELTIAGFDPAAQHRLELRVVPRGDSQTSKTFVLQSRWNGAVVHTHELKTLTATTPNELRTVLFASGSKGGTVDVQFDDYALERRND